MTTYTTTEYAGTTVLAARSGLRVLPKTFKSLATAEGVAFDLADEDSGIETRAFEHNGVYLVEVMEAK